jgi:hypothetical protein
MPNELPPDLQWDILSSDDQPGRDWTYCRAKVPGGWLVRCERWYDLGAPAISVAITFVPDPNHEWKVGYTPITERIDRRQEPLPPPPPPDQPLVAGLPPHRTVCYTPGAEAKVRYVPQNVKQVIKCINGVRTVEEVVQCSQLDETKALQILRELINHHIIELVDGD